MGQRERVWDRGFQAAGRRSRGGRRMGCRGRQRNHAYHLPLFPPPSLGVPPLKQKEGSARATAHGAPSGALSPQRVWPSLGLRRGVPWFSFLDRQEHGSEGGWSLDFTQGSPPRALRLRPRAAHGTCRLLVIQGRVSPLLPILSPGVGGALHPNKPVWYLLTFSHQHVGGKVVREVPWRGACSANMRSPLRVQRSL